MSAPTANIWVIHGPNLNALGTRQPEIYGQQTLADLDAALVETGRGLGVTVQCHQQNGEGQIIDLLHAAAASAHGVVLNPGGYTHTSVAIADAVRSIDIPTIEVHLSNLYSREPLRHRSLTAAGCAGVVMGLGTASYHVAVEHLARTLVPTGAKTT